MKRTILRSSRGKKLYAVRNSKGQFEDIQSYKLAHSADLKRKSKVEKLVAIMVKNNVPVQIFNGLLKDLKKLMGVK